MSLKNNYLFILAIILLFGLYSCTNSKTLIHHAMNEGNKIKLTERNDLKVTGTIIHPVIDKSSNRHTNVQVGFSPIKHIGIIAGQYRLSTGENASRPPISRLRANHFALGGYYFSPEKRKRKKKRRRRKNDLKIEPGWLIEFYAGVESIELENELYEFHPGFLYRRLEDANFKMKKIYLEPSFQIQKKIFGFSSSLRYSSLTFKEGVLNGGKNPTLTNHFLIVKNKNHRHLLETNFTATMGNNLLKGYLGSSINLNLLSNKSRLSSRNIVIYAGLNLSIDFFYQQKNQKRRRAKRRRRRK